MMFLLTTCVAALTNDGLIRDAEAYWIIDPSDQTCLTELGTFGACDDDALFMYLQRESSWFWRLFGRASTRRSLTMVLEPVQKRACLSTRSMYGRIILGGGDCSSVKHAQQWEMLHSNSRRYTNKQNEDAVASVALTTNRKRDCVVRDSSLWSRTARLARALAGEENAQKEKVPRGALANTVSVVSCDKRGHTPLELTASNVANSGFLFQAADGVNCYDGARFRTCSDEDRTLRWGIGIRFNRRGRPETSLFKFYNASACLVEMRGDNLGLGSCSTPASKLWGVTRGRLCRNGDCITSGKCLARSAYDGAGKLHACNMNIFEHLTLTLDSDGSDAFDPASFFWRRVMTTTWSVFMNRGLRPRFPRVINVQVSDDALLSCFVLLSSQPWRAGSRRRSKRPPRARSKPSSRPSRRRDDTKRAAHNSSSNRRPRASRTPSKTRTSLGLLSLASLAFPDEEGHIHRLDALLTPAYSFKQKTKLPAKSVLGGVGRRTVGCLLGADVGRGRRNQLVVRSHSRPSRCLNRRELAVCEAKEGPVSVSLGRPGRACRASFLCRAIHTQPEAVLGGHRGRRAKFVMNRRR